VIGHGGEVSLHQRATAWTLIAIGVLALAGCGGGAEGGSTERSATTATATSSGAWTGMGAKLADWESAHAKSSTSTGCTTGCYGGQVMDSGSSTPQFKIVTTTGAPEYRVDGYEQAIGDGTAVAAAKSAVLELLPRDTRTTAFWVAHGEGSCALWNVHSRTLGHWFATKHVGDAKGDLGIRLDTVNTSSESAFEPSNVSHASVSILPNSKGDSC
jgi:hypothetical protein